MSTLRWEDVTDLFDAQLVGSLPDGWVEVTPEGWVLLRCLSVDSIDFDLNVKAFQGQERLDALCDFLRAVGRALGRSVWVGAEGSTADRMYGYDVATDSMVRRAEHPPWD